MSVFSNSVFSCLFFCLAAKLVNSNPLSVCRTFHRYSSAFVPFHQPFYKVSLLKNECFAPHIPYKILSWYTHRSPCIWYSFISRSARHFLGTQHVHLNTLSEGCMSSARMALVYIRRFLRLFGSILVFITLLKTFKTACIPLFSETMP